jgi:hypothetical protein
VCRSWQAAAAGCRRIRLLYCCGWRDAADEAFADWLRHRSPQLEALTLSGDSGEALEALADAAAAAADDSPLELHTLRVLDCDVDLPLAGRLVANLPLLHTLQLDIKPQHIEDIISIQRIQRLVTEHLGPLQSATLLEELYLGGPFITSGRRVPYASAIAKLLPLSLKRLSWSTHTCPIAGDLPDLTHLTQLSYVQLLSWNHRYQCLPPSVRELELFNSGPSLEGLLQQREVLVGTDSPLWDLGRGGDPRPVHGREHPNPFTRVKTLHVTAVTLSKTAACDAMASMESLSTLKVRASQALPVLPAGGGAGRFSRLRNLHLHLQIVPDVTGLSAATGITRLTLSELVGWPGGPMANPSWGNEVGQMQGLRWLSVPAVLLAEGGAWLGGLQQLQVLVLNDGWHGNGSLCKAWLSSLDGGGLQLVPPRLQVVGVTMWGVWMKARQRLRCRLQQLLSSGGCEVVAGVSLDQLADPTQRLAGLPEGLRQVLTGV